MPEHVRSIQRPLFGSAHRRRVTTTGCLRRIYDSRSQNDFRNHPHYRADDSVRWIFLADLADEQGQRVHGESAPTEFLPRWPRPRGRYRDFVTGLPDARGCGSSSNTYALVRSNRSATLRDSHFGGFFLSVLPATATQASGAVALIYAGAVILA